MLAPSVYRGKLSKEEYREIGLLLILEIVLLYIILHIPFLVHFFDVTTPYPSLREGGEALVVLLVFGALHYVLAKRFLPNKDRSA